MYAKFGLILKKSIHSRLKAKTRPQPSRPDQGDPHRPLKNPPWSKKINFDYDNDNEKESKSLFRIEYFWFFDVRCGIRDVGKK